MNKKEYIIKVLESLVGHWDMANEILILVQKVTLDKKVLDAIKKMLQSAIKKVTGEELSDKLTAWMEIIEKIRRIENVNKEKEAEELQELEKQIDELIE